MLGTVTTAAGTYFTDSTVTAGSTTVTTGIGLPIGFTFAYNGNNFDVFGVNADGWIAFGQSALAPSSVNMNTSSATAPISATSTAPAALQNRVCAFGRGISAQPIARLRYKTMGTAPNRTLVVEWRNYKRSGGGANTDTLNFQIRLTETSNTVEFIYGKMKISSANGTTVQVGLRGQANTDFNNRTTTTNWAATTAGGANNSTCTISTTNYPASGLSFIWKPPLADDAGVTMINSPAAIISSGLQKIAVTIKDFGTDSLKNVTIKWSINGMLQSPYTWSGAIAHGATSGPDTIGTYTFNSGYYTIKAWTYNPNLGADLNNANDTTTKIVYIQAYATIPFNEGNDSTWVSKLNTRDVPTVYWVNTPATGNNSWRRDDDGTAAAWTTTSGNYTPAGANNTIHSARFHSYDATAALTGTMDAYLNFTPVGTKILKFWYINPSGTDSLALYISNDGGSTFTYLTKYTTAAAWTQYTYTLGTSISATTVLRFKATSDYGNDDIGIDGVQVYLQPANDMEAYAWVTPVSGCGLTNTATVTVKVINKGTNSQSNIPVKYSINGGSTFAGTEYISGPVNPGDTATYAFTGTANFTNPGTYHCLFVVKLTSDQNHSNDTIFTTVTSVGTIQTFPFTENFNNGGSNYFLLSAAANASANYLDTLGVNNTGCAFFTGFSSNTGWTGTGTISAAAAYGTYTSHLSTLMPCSVNATGLSALRMSFDLKQMYYTQKTYTWMVLVANGTDTLTDINGVKYYNPVTTNADPFTTRTFDLTSLAGTSFTLEFASACKYNAAAGAPGNNNYIDNVMFWVPVLNDAGVTAVSSPVSSPCGNANDSLIVTVKNFGLDTLNNIPVTVNVTTQSGTHVLFNNTLVGPLAPNATASLVVGHGSTVSAGTYNIAAYTHLTGDTVFTNDTTHYTFEIYPALTIPYLENFETTTPLANWSVTNFLSGNGHGNNSHVMYATLSGTATTATAKMNKQKIGPVTNHSYLTFDYRIVNSPNGTAGVTLTTDSVFILLSGDCGATYDTIHIIDAGNHVSSTTMKHVAIPIATYIGDNVIPGFFVKRASAGVGTTYFVDIDNVAFSDAAIVNLGPDTAFCPGGNISFDAGESSTGYVYTYAWSTLLHHPSIATSQTITVDSAATYIAAVNNGYGVITNDTVVVSYFPVPVVSLGPDTLNCGSFTLDPGAGFSSYTWSTGVHSQSINVTNTGGYTVTVTNSKGCSSSDSAHVTIIPLPTVYAGPAQSICYLDTLNIVNSTAANYNSLLWTTTGDGYFDDNTLLHPQYILGTNDITNTTVTLILTNFAICDTVSSTVVVTITTTPTAFAGNDQTICSGSTAQLSATGGTTYVWSPASSLNNADIANPLASPTSTTTYTVTVTSSCGSETDNVKVTVDHITAPNLGLDTTLCAGLSFPLNAGAGYDSYLWSTGAITQHISVDTTGIGIGAIKAYVNVTKGVCSASDTIKITFTSCVGIIEYNGATTVNIYPNPTTGTTNIVVNGLNNNADLTIYTFLGQSVYSEKITGNLTRELDLSYLPKGIYVIRVSNEKTNIISKLIIQ